MEVKQRSSAKDGRDGIDLGGNAGKVGGAVLAEDEHRA